MAQKVKTPQMAPSKTVDANGWTVYDFGTWKEYRKTVTYSQSFTAGAAVAVTLSSNSLPVGLSTLGSNFLNFSSLSTGFGADVLVVAEMSSGSAQLGFVAKGDVTRTQGGRIDVTIIGA